MRLRSMSGSCGEAAVRPSPEPSLMSMLMFPVSLLCELMQVVSVKGQILPLGVRSLMKPAEISLLPVLFGWMRTSTFFLRKIPAASLISTVVI